MAHYVAPPFRAYRGSEPYIFISYSHADSDELYPELARLHADGFRMWYDEGITESKGWSKEIAEALEGASHFIVFLTEHSCASDFVLKEINFALAKKKPFLAVHLHKFDVPSHIELLTSDIQAVMKWKLEPADYAYRMERSLDPSLREGSVRPVALLTDTPPGKSWLIPGLIGGALVLAALIGLLLLLAPSLFATPDPIVTWGWNADGQCQIPDSVKHLKPDDIAQIGASENYSIILKKDGTVIPWGNYSDGVTNPPKGLSDVTTISADSHILALKKDGTLVSWGEKSYYLEEGLDKIHDIAKIYSGQANSAVLHTDGSLFIWGRDDDGLCTKLVPEGLKGQIAQVAIGTDFILVLKTDGSVVAWGDNSNGQCTLPAGLHDVVQLAACGSECAALQRDGHVVAWGWNKEGECDVPKDLTDVVEIAVGSFQMGAVKKDGSVVVWGDNTYHQLDVPAQLAKWRVVHLATGQCHFVALVSGTR